jgi:hypothetical protein
MWAEYKVELLNARALPWDLLRLAAVFSSADTLVRRAASDHLHHIAEHLHFLEEVDFSKTLAEQEYWQDLSKRRFEPGIRSRIDADRVMFVEGQLERYVDTYSRLNDSFFSLAALGFFSAGLLREQIMDALDGQSWATKHEVLARCGWMTAHRELLQKGKSPLAPYSCSVTHKDQDGRQVDEEFNNLIMFLHLLRSKYGEECIFVRKSETPDFVLEREQGTLIGAEMTDVWISDEWGKEQDAAYTVLKYIHNRFQDQIARIHVPTPRSWRVLASRLQEVGEWISSELIRIGTLQADMRLKNNDLDLEIRLTQAERAPAGISCGSNMARGITDIDKHSRDLLESLRAGMERKVVKNDKQRDKPSVRPCHLVIYPRSLLDANLETVLRDFFQSPPIDVSSHFERVWLCDGQRLVRLS